MTRNRPMIAGARRSLPAACLVFLSSGRLAVWLLAALVVVVLCHLLLPQVLLPLGVTAIRGSWPVYIISTLIFVNLALCMIRRFRSLTSLWRMPRRLPSDVSSWNLREVSCTGVGADEIARRLRRRGYRTLADGNTVYGLRGRFAVVGHWLFHVGLLVLLGAGAYLIATPTSFRAVLGLGEGEAFDLRTAGYLGRSGALGADLPDLAFTMNTIDVAVQGNDLRRFDVRLTTPEEKPVVLGINRPHRAPPYQVVSQGFGYMPGWAILDRRGRMVRGAWIKLAPFPLQMEEVFSLGPKLSDVRFTFHPDHREGEAGAGESHELHNPRFRTVVQFRGREVFNGLLEPGQRVSLAGAGEFLFLPEIRRYALLEVRQERGHLLVFTAFGILIAGLFLRYARIRKEIHVEMSGGWLRIHGRSEILESLFSEELDGLALELTRAPAPWSARRGVA